MKIKLLLSLVLPVTFLFAQAEIEVEPDFQSNEYCKKCHPDIYKEYEKSMHRNSTIFKDPIHKAVWDKHPTNTKKQKYKCAKCHTPTADNIKDMLGKGTKGIPDVSNETHTQGILCSYCHRIESVEHGSMSSTNKIHLEKKDYYGTREKPLRSRKHYQKYSEDFKNGQVCMGCHSHKKNSSKLDVCVTDMGKEDDSENCITCHMPQVKGDMSSKGETGTYAFHGFPGANLHKEKLLHYINMKFIKEDTGFQISIKNRSPHNLMLHPMRYTQLLVSVERDSKVQEFKPEVFIRMIGKDDKASPPWVANEVVKDTMIKGKETRKINYEKVLRKGDKVKVTLGYYLVKPDVAKKFAIKTSEHLSTFHILKDKTYTVE
ncbi:MAG: hypothetical protein ACI9TV_001353 [Sulfurimonas sp.]|jgi:hypothetical protein|uniref:multiheme c-type cytochrome n=1 Tax=Sulfurimonas sp. TaxID=2022749 RepID=UPI0039E51E23